jgi:hypothetical protein
MNTAQPASLILAVFVGIAGLVAVFAVLWVIALATGVIGISGWAPPWWRGTVFLLAIVTAPVVASYFAIVARRRYLRARVTCREFGDSR